MLGTNIVLGMNVQIGMNLCHPLNILKKLKLIDISQINQMVHMLEPNLGVSPC